MADSTFSLPLSRFKEHAVPVKNPKQPTATIRFEHIERRFTLAAYTWFDGTFKPAVIKREDGTYSIRVLTSSRTRGAKTTDRYGYFVLSREGIIAKSPYGFGRDYNGMRVTGVEDAVARYAAPAAAAPRLALPGPTPERGSAPVAAGDCGHGADANRTRLRPEVASAVKEIREQVGRRMRELRERADLPYLAKAQVRAGAVSGMDWVEIEVRLPMISVHSEGARERRDGIASVCRELAVEFDELLASKQTRPPYIARTTITDPHSTYGVN